MNNSIHQKLGATAAFLLILAQPGPAVADAPAQPSAADDKQTGSALEEIVVTAERHAASLHDVPIAISAFSGTELQSEHITTIEALARTVPDVQFSSDLGMARIFIRGVGLDSESPGADPRVAIYTDEVYNSRPQAGFASFFDVDRIEVLKGPQGTLYGRNATAGAVNVITRDPTDELSGYGTISYGNYRLVQTEGAIGGPLTEQIDGRFAFTTTNRDGFGRNISTGGEVDDENRRAVRGKLLIKLAGDATVLLQGDYSNEADHGDIGEHFLGNTPGNENIGQEQGFILPTGPYDAAGINPNTYIRTYGASAKADLHLGEFKFTSISAYRHVTSSVSSTADGSSASLIPISLAEKSNQYTQELRLDRTFGPVDALVGVYFFHELNSALTVANISSADVPAFFETQNCCIGIPPQPSPFTMLAGGYFGGAQNTNAYALFTQETWHITNQLGLDLGGRYSYEKRDIEQFYQFDLTRPAGSLPILTATAFPVPATYATQGKSWRAFNPKVTLHYNFTPDVMAYVTYTTGFKSGGFNFSQIQPAFNPEKLTDWEGGVKADFFEHRLRADLAAFHYTYANLQVNSPVNTSLITTNAGAAKVDGVEGQLSAVPIDGLQLDLSAAWLDARYTDFTTVDPDKPQLGPQNLAGNQLQYAPRFKVNGGIRYTIDTKWGGFRPRADVTWTDRVFFSQFNLPYLQQNSYFLGNLYLDWDAGHGLTTTAFLQNVGDTRYVISAVQASLFVGTGAVGSYGSPRTFGISLTKRF